jgi:Tfp pilus assembly protein PilX
MARPSSIPSNPSSIIHHQSESGSVLLVVVLLVALLAAVVMGHLQVNTEEIQLMRNHVGGAEALALAEAGLNDALAQLRRDPDWCAGYTNKPFSGGSYSVVVHGSTVTATALTSRGFVAKVQADLTRGPAAQRPSGPGAGTTRGTGGSGSLVEVSKLRINP